MIICRGRRSRGGPDLEALQDTRRLLHYGVQADAASRRGHPADVGSHRQIYAAQSSPDDEAWFAENLKRDRDYSWDGNRVELPPGVQKVSNICDATRKR